MPDYGQQICEDVVAYLDTQVYSLPIITSAPQDPHTELNLDAKGEVYTDIRVFVVPLSQTEEKGDRGGHVAIRQTVNLFVSRFLKDPEFDGVERKDMSNLLAEIRESLRFVCMQDWVWEITETVMPYDPDKLRVQFRFLSVLSITYWNAM